MRANESNQPQFAIDTDKLNLWYGTFQSLFELGTF